MRVLRDCAYLSLLTDADRGRMLLFLLQLRVSAATQALPCLPPSLAPSLPPFLPPFLPPYLPISLSQDLTAPLPYNLTTSLSNPNPNPDPNPNRDAGGHRVPLRVVVCDTGLEPQAS